MVIFRLSGTNTVMESAHGNSRVRISSGPSDSFSNLRMRRQKNTEKQTKKEISSKKHTSAKAKGTSPKNRMTSPKKTMTSTDKTANKKGTKSQSSTRSTGQLKENENKKINKKKTIKNAPGGRRIATQSSRCLLEDDDVRRWYENMKRSSQLNAAVRLRRLNLFCYRLKTTPATLARTGKKDPKKIEDMLMDHVSWMESQNFSSGYIRPYA